MKPEDFASVAGMLVEHTGGHEEGRKRTAVSRYYYAAFLEARRLLKEKRGLSFLRRHDPHKCVRQAFERANPKGLKAIGRLLESSKNLREKADYDIDVAFDPGAAGEAKRLLADIQSRLAAADLTECIDPVGRS